MAIGISEAARELFRWAKSHEFRGHDPHDMLESPVFARISNPTLRLLMLQLGRRSPVDLRPLLKVPRAENPKGLALFLCGLLTARERVDPEWRREAGALARRLVDLQSSQGGWGYPFGWQSRTHYIPRGKPNIVTTAFCGMALIEASEQGILDASDVVASATAYILQRVPQVQDGAALAFGYAEDDPQIVYNASLLGAELLAKASVLLEQPQLARLAVAAADYVVQRQLADGSWYYGELPSQKWIDSFHTGFVIDSLYAIGKIVGNKAATAAADRGLEYYLRTFLKTDDSVRYFATKEYPVDAHAVGEAMSMLARAGHSREANRLAEWSIRNLRSDRGYFYYQRHALYTNRIAYMRWSNAWMFRGLCDLMTQQ